MLLGVLGKRPFHNSHLFYSLKKNFFWSISSVSLANNWMAHLDAAYLLTRVEEGVKLIAVREDDTKVDWDSRTTGLVLSSFRTISILNFK